MMREMLVQILEEAEPRADSVTSIRAVDVGGAQQTLFSLSARADDPIWKDANTLGRSLLLAAYRSTNT